MHRENEFLRNETQKPKFSVEEYEKQQIIIQTLTKEKNELQDMFRNSIAKQNQVGKIEAEYKVKYFLI